MLTVLASAFNVQKLFDGESVLVLDQITDFLETFEGLVGAGKHQVVEHLHNVFVEVADLPFRPGLLKDLLKSFMLLDSLAWEWIEELSSLLVFFSRFHHCRCQSFKFNY